MPAPIVEEIMSNQETMQDDVRDELSEETENQNQPSCDVPADDPWLANAYVTIPSTQQAEVRKRMTSLLSDMLSTMMDEGVRQYASGIRDGIDAGRETVRASGHMFARLRRFLSQPVWIPGRNKKPKQYSRGTLFLIDTARFGTTFAVLFFVLFSALNYQSFWAIAESYIEPLASITAPEQEDSVVIQQELTEKLSKVPSLHVAGNSYAILDVLPSVGPPENRIVIPSLDLNVPIVIPPRTALLAENWKQLEEDIQRSLQDGVVHYPGTAQPGQPGNFFITGHSSYFPWAPGKYKSVFARLSDLHVGDEYWIFYGGDRFRYRIREKKEIRPSDVSVLDQPVSKRIATLMTCTPVGTTLRRLIIVAQEVDPVTGEDMEIGEHQTLDTTPKLRMDLLPI